MPRLNYQLKVYIKAVDILAQKKGFNRVEMIRKKGGYVFRFEAFIGEETKPHSMWTVHTEHNRKEIVYSMEDYKKIATNLVCSMEEVLQVLKECK